jgi:predicted  nucleic acid-binding Zn ribbon protein
MIIVPSRDDKDSIMWLEEEFDTWLDLLTRHGNTIGQRTDWWADGKLYANFYLPFPDALDKRNWERFTYTDAAYERMMSYCQHEPSTNILGEDKTGQHAQRWEDVTCLYLKSHPITGLSPINSGDSGKPIPLYLFPFEYAFYDEAYFWARRYERIDELWMSTGPLELECYRELADPNSFLSRSGRDVAATVEAVTGKPTYYYLMRYCGNDKVSQQQVCPICGLPWAQDLLPFQRFNINEQWVLRCDRCRLVSELATDFDYVQYDPVWAEIGEFHAPELQTDDE